MPYSIPVTSSTAPTTNWHPLEVITRHDPELLSFAMHLETLLTPAGNAEGYKHTDTRRTLYVLPEMVAKYRYDAHTQAGSLLPFRSVIEALAWWTS